MQRVLKLVTVLLIISNVVLAAVVANYDFETTYGDWRGRGAASIALSDAVAHGGSKSLYVSGRTAGWHGASLDLTAVLKPTRQYKFEGWVYQNSGSDQVMIITMQRTYSGESRGWDRIAQVVAPSGKWTKIEGTYTVRASADELLFYFESENATLDFYIDDVLIVDLTGAMIFDFEKDLGNWQNRGAAKIELSSAVAHSGSKSLYISGRTSGWHGAQLVLTDILKPTRQYKFEGWVYQNSGSDQPIIITMQRVYAGESRGWDRIATVTAPSGKWVKIEGVYTVRAPAEELVFYFESDNATLDFYVDDVMIIDLSAPVGEAAAQFEFVAKFEDNLNGFAPFGRAELSRTDVVASEGKYSLKISGRALLYDGCIVDMTKFAKDLVDSNMMVIANVYHDCDEPKPFAFLLYTKTKKAENYSYIGYKIAMPKTWSTAVGYFNLKADDYEKVAILIVSPNAVDYNFYIDNFQVLGRQKAAQVKIPPDFGPVALKELFAEHFKIGVALPVRVFSNSMDVELITKHFNSMTAENEMKPESILRRDASGKIYYDFTVADRYIEFAQKHGMVVRGHTLVWHSQTPEWFFKDEKGNLLSREAMIERMREYIHTVVGRYRGKVYAWDVVNEAVDENQPDGLRRSLWYQVIGPDYIELAFKFAHEADPDALLFYNDYNEYHQKKRDVIYNMVKNMKEKGIPIHGIGMQQHINIGTSIEQIEQAIALYATIPGIVIEITELDVNIYRDNATKYEIPPIDLLIQQANFYRRLFEVYKKYSDVINNVTFWGLKDDYSWLRGYPVRRNNWPLLFDENYNAKLAYWALVKPELIPASSKEGSIVPGEAIIAGTMDDSFLQSPPIKIVVDGNDKLIARVIWGEDKLYIYADVYDATRNPDKDGVAIFVDPKNFKAPFLHDQAAYVIFWYNREIEKSENVEVERFLGPAYRRYSVEAAISMPGVKFSRDQLIGFDIAVIDDGKWYSWSDTTNQQKFSTLAYGTLKLEGIKTGKAMYGTPVIDGEIDDIWNKAEELETDVVVMGSLQNASAKFRVLWDEEYLYVLAIVKDPVLNKDNSNAWEQDSIEIFISETNHKTPPYRDGDGQFRVNFTNQQSFGTGASAARFKTATKIVEGGYLVEAAVKWSVIKPQAGMTIGFDFQVNDANAQGRRVGILKWCDPTDNTWQNMSKVGNLILTK
ncbi:endo-1,4-beta-xylanase [Pseudothermotoga thermarum]|uniref:Beta-xylanase n=1 Tax=Pseudothermotoga thermarum DSM 5069 TaxID=688269 RepID=F7YVM4_9THEM|nr:endo-1,4-beta-xylanase [Pseudothermotoga thermarum]AEH51685.1 Endo-1,4-beta-xylanase [Pseudothermotoga thermarum DSM 5069]